MRAFAVGMLLAAVACARDGRAQGVATVRDDAAALARYLDAVRGANPVLCELATRSADAGGWWSRFGPLSDNPLDVDSASATLVAWIQRGHKNAAVVPRLRAGLRDTDACVRRVAGGLLGRVDHPSATAALVAALDDTSADTRYVAALGLGMSERSATNGAVASLIRRLADDSPRVRRSAAWALGSVEARAALVPLIELLGRDSDPRVRQTAAWAIGQIDG
jgi:HEAT repeat protein